MEANDLMAGDLMQSKSGRYLRVMQITSLLDDCIMLEDGTEWKANDLSPIPLTPDVLKLNDFNIEMNDYVWTDGVHSAEQVYVAISFHRDGSLRRVDIHNFGCQFYCDRFSCAFDVSKFQRALRMCGFDDLAENFKVE